MSIFPRIAIDEKALSIEKIQSIIQQYPIQVVVLKPFRLGGIDRMLDAMKILKEKKSYFSLTQKKTIFRPLYWTIIIDIWINLAL